MTKKTLTLSALSLLIIFLFFSCNKDLFDDDSDLVKVDGNNVTSTTKIVTAKEVPDVASSFADFIKEMNNQDFFVDTKIYELTNLKEEKSYSAQVYLGDFEDNRFYNIAVKRNSDQSLETSKIIEYQTSMPKNTINTNNFKNSTWKLNNYNTYSLKEKLKGSISKNNASSSPCSGDGVFIPEGGTGFNVSHLSGDNFSDNIFNSDNGGNLGGSGTGTRSGWVSVCFATLELTPYSCNGRNSGTPHSPGDCGDASTGYGGSGEKLSVGEYCTPIYVTVETQTAPISGFLDVITFDFGLYSPCTLQKLRDKLKTDRENLDTLGLELLEELIRLLGEDSIEHCNPRNDGGPVIPDFSKSTSQKSTGTDCPEPFDVNVIIPSNSWDLFEILNTASTPLGDTALTDAQKIWILDHRNIDGVDALLTFINENGNSTNTRSFAKELIDIMSSELTPDINALNLVLEAFSQDKIYNNFDEVFFNSVNQFMEIDIAAPNNPGLIQLQIYFSTQCAVLRFNHPDWSDTKIYWEASKDMVHIALDVFGLIPVVGEIADLTNGVLYTIEGDGLNATLSFASAVPVVGWAAAGTKYAVKIVNASTTATTIVTKVRLTWKVLADGTIYFGSSGSKLRKVLGITDSALQAHHLIPWAIRNHNVVQQAAKSGNAFHMNEALNGIAVASWRNQPNHNLYNNRIEALLDALPDGLTPDQAYNHVTNILSTARNAIINNPNTHLNDLIF